MENAALKPPNFVELLNLIHLHAPWEPTFPAHYYNVRALVPTNPVVPAPAPPSAGIIAASNPLLAAGGTPAPAPTGPATPRARGSVQRKPTPINPCFQRFVDMNLRVRDVIVRAGKTN
jgi:hypothetical protein